MLRIKKAEIRAKKEPNTPTKTRKTEKYCTNSNQKAPNTTLQKLGQEKEITKFQPKKHLTPP